MVMNVTSVLYYTKRVILHGKEELEVVTVKEMLNKEGPGGEWLHCLEVDLKLQDDGDMEKKSAKEMVDMWELLRDSWQQLAHGL